MSVPDSYSRTFKLGRIFVFISGLFPLTVGCYYYIHNILYREFNFVEHIAFSNLIVTGVTVCVLTFFELKHKKIWIILLLLFILIWAGGNDTYALIRNYNNGSGIFPFSLFPILTGTIGLILISRDLINE